MEHRTPKDSVSAVTTLQTFLTQLRQKKQSQHHVATIKQEAMATAPCAFVALTAISEPPYPAVAELERRGKLRLSAGTRWKARVRREQQR